MKHDATLLADRPGESAGSLVRGQGGSVGRGDLQVFRDVPDVRDAQASFRYSWHSPFKLVDSRQNGYIKYAHNLNANSFFVNILFLIRLVVQEIIKVM